ncbi:hypothetical protein LTS03_004003 [Exophiala xenobiotica]|nr:hypothetical protein LTR61_004486 [Exophiala xenobiotica]KAK5381163.1 hypothetical protein LTS03_004003 [Exophiala xenobiotica]
MQEQEQDQETASEKLIVQAQLWITSIQDILRTSALAPSSADPSYRQESQKLEVAWALMCVAADARKSPTMEIEVDTPKGPVKMRALLDSGSTKNVISQTFAIAYELQPTTTTVRLRNVSGQEIRVYGEHRLDTAATDMRGRYKKRTHPYLAADIQAHDVILGYPWLKDVNPRIDWEKGTWCYSKDEVARVVAKHDMSETEVQALTKERDEAIAEPDNVRRTAKATISRLENERDTIASERELWQQKAQPPVRQTESIDRLAQERDALDALVLKRDKLEQDIQTIKDAFSKDNIKLAERLEEVCAIENEGVQVILNSLRNKAGSDDLASIYEVFWEHIMHPLLLQEEDPTMALKLNHQSLAAATIKEKFQGPRQSVQSSPSRGLSSTPIPTPSVPVPARAPWPWEKAEPLSSGLISPAAIERPTTPHTTIRRGTGGRSQQEEELPSSPPTPLPSREKREGSSKRGLIRLDIFADQPSSTPKRRQETHIRSQLTKNLFDPPEGGWGLQGLRQPPGLGLTDEQKQLPALPVEPSSASQQAPSLDPTKSLRRRPSTASFRAPTASSLARSQWVRQKRSTISLRPSARTETPSRSDHSSSPTKGRSAGKGLLGKFGFTSKSGSKAGGEDIEEEGETKE